MLNLGILVSGSGTNLQSVLDAISNGRLDARACVVISNKPGVMALERATRAGVPTVVISHKDFSSREAFDTKLVEVLRAHAVDTVALAGFMRIITSVLLDAFSQRVVNIHPSLLPAFPGVDAQEQAFRAGVKITGCTVHFVDSGTDTGPMIAQSAVPIVDGDTAQTVRERILSVEHQLFPRVLQWLSEGRVRVDHGRVIVRDATASFAVSSPSMDGATR